MTADDVSLIVGLAGGAIGLVSFFAALVFYIQGNRINRATEKILTTIEAKVTLIQGDYGRIVDRTFSLAEGSSSTVIAGLTREITTLGESLKDSISSVIRRSASPEYNRDSRPSLVELEGQVGAIIERKIADAKEEASKIIEISGYRATYDGIVRLVLRSLCHGPILGDAVREYMRAHCFDLLQRDLMVLLDRLEVQGLVTQANELNEQLRHSEAARGDAFWKLTEAGEALVRRGLSRGEDGS